MHCTKCGAEINAKYILNENGSVGAFSGDLAVTGGSRLDGKSIHFALCRECFDRMAIRYLGVGSNPVSNDVFVIMTTFAYKLRSNIAKTVFHRITKMMDMFEGHVVISSPEDCHYLPEFVGAIRRAANHVIQVREDGDPERRIRAIKDILYCASDGGRIIFCGAYTDTHIKSTALAMLDAAHAQGNEIMIADALSLGTSLGNHVEAIEQLTAAGINLWRGGVEYGRKAS